MNTEEKIIEIIGHYFFTVKMSKKDMSEMKEKIKSKLQLHREEVRHEIENELEREISIHKQLEGDCVGSIEDIKLNRKSENPHTFVIDQLKVFKNKLSNLK